MRAVTTSKHQPNSLMTYSTKKKKSKRQPALSIEKQQHLIRGLGVKRGTSDASSFTKSTATTASASTCTAGAEWNGDGSSSSRSISISSLKSSSSSLNSSMDPGFMMAPLNDMGSGPLHFSGSGSNDSSLSASSNHTRGSNSNSNSNWGESSLSSFLSVLLEDEEANPIDISIVADNPKPEHRSIQDLRLSFIRSAIKNDKPKCRWEYLTRDNNDRERLARSTRRSKLEHRSESFSGAIDDTKQKVSFPSRNSNGSINSKDNSPNGSKNANSGSVSNNMAGMFLRMPVRKNSPMTTAVKNKSLMSRVNMSDTDLILLPMQPGSSGVSDRKSSRRSSKGPSLSSNRRRFSSNESLTGKPERRGLSRSGDRNESNGNASWSKADTMKERRRKKSNDFLDFLLEPETDSKSGWPSPLPSPAIISSRRVSLGTSQRELLNMSSSFFSLQNSSDEEENDEDKMKGRVTKNNVPPPKQSSFSKKTFSKQANPKQPRRSSCSSSKSSSSKLNQKYHKKEDYHQKSSDSFQVRLSPEKCDSRPPQLPTRFNNPTSPLAYPKSPKGTSRKKRVSLPDFIPLKSPKSPKGTSRKKKVSLPDSTLLKSPKGTPRKKKASLPGSIPLKSPKSSKGTSRKKKVSLPDSTPLSPVSPKGTSRKKRVSLPDSTPLSPVSPKGTSRKKRVSLPDSTPLSPVSPKGTSRKKRVSLPTFTPLSPENPLTTISSKSPRRASTSSAIPKKDSRTKRSSITKKSPQTITTTALLSPKKSRTQRRRSQPKIEQSPRPTKEKWSPPKTAGPNPTPPSGKWYSPFDCNQDGF